MDCFGKHFTKYWKVLLSVILLMSSLSAGNDLKGWGEVAPEYLSMTVFADDTSASAIKIFDQAVVSLEIAGSVEMIFERHFQIKILKEKGKNFADMAIPYWHEDNISNLEAQVIQPNGEVIELDDDNIFDEETQNIYRVKKLAFPNVQVGSILEVSYKQKSSVVHQLEPWYFHQSIPVVESEIIIHLTPLFTYLVNIGNDPDKLVEYTEGEYYNRFRGKWETEFRYKAKNLPAIKDEPFISCLDNYRAHVNFQIKSVGFPGFYQEYITDITTLSNRLLDKSYEDFDEPDSEAEDLVENLVSTGMDNNQKARIIFEYVRDNFNSDAGTSVYVSKNQEEILDQKEASDTEKNLLLKVMLQAAGFEVIPILISTTSHGLANPEIPFLSQYNKTILLVNIDNNYYLFDARDRWITYGQLPPSSLVKNALLVQRDNPSFLEIPNEDLRSMDLIESHVQVLPEGKLTGTSEILAIGYASRKHNMNIDEHKNISKMITEELADDIERFTVTNSDSAFKAVPADTFHTKFEFEMDNFTENIDNEIYFKPAMYFDESSNVFVSEKRSFPVEFAYRWRDVETTYFTFPQGYSVSEMPKSIVIENEYVKYERITIVTNDNPVTLGFSRQFEIKKLVVPAKDYSLIKNDFSKIVDADQEVIIMKYSE